MSSTLFLAFCILGCDLLLYILFQWTYGEKRRGLARRTKLRGLGAASHKTPPIEFVLARRRETRSRERPVSGKVRLQKLDTDWQDGRSERETYQRIVTSFARAKS